MSELSKVPVPTPEGSLAGRWWKVALGRTDLMLFVGLWFAVFFYGARNWIWGTGLGFAAFNMAVWFIARRQLGGSFAITADARELVTTGLYRRFRHPIYYFGTLAHLGLVVAYQLWWLVPIWIGPPLVIQWKRMKREDVVLEAKFGEAFRRLREGAWI